MGQTIATKNQSMVSSYPTRVASMDSDRTPSFAVTSTSQGPRWKPGFLATVFVLFICAVAAQAEQSTKVPRIGYLAASIISAESRAAITQGLRKLGYIEGQNIKIEYRYAEGKFERLPILAAELVRLNVDVILTGGSTATRAAKEATSTIPIVMTQDNDPVASGFVASLARPGGNITGLSTLRPEISGKRLELLKEVVPGLSRVAVLGASDNPGNAQALKEVELAAGALKLQLQYLDIRSPKDIEPAFQEARKASAGGVLELGGPLLNVHQTALVNLATKSRMPVMWVRRRFVEAGGLMYYGVDTADLNRRAATFVDKILKGAKPGDLPVEQPTKFEFVINLKAAKKIGLTIPPNVLARADKIIK
jgi:putative tryptophan/tyrosine transport system substrate-binding protein